MITHSINETIQSTLQGKVALYTCENEEDLLAEVPGKLLFQDKNLVVSNAGLVIANLLKRDFENFMPFYITVGDGGDLEQVSKTDSGAKVQPALTDTAVRSVVGRIPIAQVTPDESDPYSWTYIGIAKPNQANTLSLNELGLEAFNKSLISHYVTQTASGSTRAQKYIKTPLEYLVVRWTLTFTLV